MLGGPFYIWMMVFFFSAAAGLIVLLGGILWIGHWLEKRETGATHGFLEMPEELREPPSEVKSDKTREHKA